MEQQIKTNVVTEWYLSLDYYTACEFMELIKKIAESGEKAGFKKSIVVSKEEIEICKSIVTESINDFEFVNKESVKQEIKNL